MTVLCSSVLKHKPCTFFVAEVSTFAGGDQRGGAPPQQALENAPLSFTSQPNLNLTMEPAQYACNPIHDPGSADQPEYLLLAFKKKVFH